MQFTFQPSEFVDFAVVAAVTPLVVAVWRRTAALRGTWWWIATYGFIASACAATIAEGVGGALGEWLNLCEHTSLFAAGVSSVLLVRHLRSNEGRIRG